MKCKIIKIKTESTKFRNKTSITILIDTIWPTALISIFQNTKNVIIWCEEGVEEFVGIYVIRTVEDLTHKSIITTIEDFMNILTQKFSKEDKLLVEKELFKIL